MLKRAHALGISRELFEKIAAPVNVANEPRVERALTDQENANAAAAKPGVPAWQTNVPGYNPQSAMSNQERTGTRFGEQPTPPPVVAPAATAQLPSAQPASSPSSPSSGLLSVPVPPPQSYLRRPGTGFQKNTEPNTGNYAAADIANKAFDSFSNKDRSTDPNFIPNAKGSLLGLNLPRR